MGWFAYYTLLKRYDGDLSKATESELKLAKAMNPNDSETAKRIAEEKYQQEKR